MENTCPHCNHRFEDCSCDWDQLERDMGESVILSSHEPDDDALLQACQEYGL